MAKRQILKKTSIPANAPTKPQNEKVTKAQYHPPNRANVFCFLSSLPLLLPVTTAVFGSYLSSLY